MANRPASVCLVPLLYAVLCLPAIVAGAQEAAETAETQDRHEESLRRFFDRHLAALTRDGDRVRFEAAEGGNIGKYDPQRHQWLKSFTLAEGERFFQQDRHARSEFTVLEIRADGVLIEARSLFDQRAFGTEKTGGDSTVILLPYRERGSGS